MEVYLILFVFVVAILIMIVFFNKKIQELKEQQNAQDPYLSDWLKSTQSNLFQVQKALNDFQQTMNSSLLTSQRQVSSTLQENTKDIHERLSKAAEVIGELKREAGAFSEVSRSMKELHEFLKSPKLRGNIGEQVLNDLVSQMFPKEAFYIQHKFHTGNTVDLALRTDAGILSIDAKFPMESFLRMMKATDADRTTLQKEFVRDVKKHINDISSKYILSDEGTLDFALMYLPSESVYYEVVNSPELMEYARSLRIYVVSPSTLYAVLQTLLLSFEGKKFEKKTKEILAMVRAIKKDHEKLGEQLSTLSRHITNAQSAMTTVGGTYTKLGQKVESGMELEEEKKNLQLE